MQQFIKDISADQLWGYVGLLLIIWLLIVFILYRARRIDKAHKGDATDKRGDPEQGCAGKDGPGGSHD